MKWYKAGGYWRRLDGDRDGTNDLIFNSLSKIIMDGDTSTWAVNCFFQCADLLQRRLRFPSYLLTGREAPNRYIWYILKFLRIKKYDYRSQDDCTRDGYIAFGACYEHLMEFANCNLQIRLSEAFEKTTVPWWLYRPSTFIWRRRLIKDNTKLYVKRLRYLRALATVKHFERTNKLWKQ